MPTVSPLGPTRRTSETRIRSLIRSSVLMCPPDENVSGGRHRPEPPRKSRTASACHKRKPVATRLPSRESCLRGPRRAAAPKPARPKRAGPDPTTCARRRRSMRVGGRTANLRLSISLPCEHSGTNRSTRDSTGSFLRRPNPGTAAPDPAQPPAGRQPGRSSPSIAKVVGPATSTTNASAPSWIADCAASLVATGTGRASGFQASSCAVPVNASSAVRPSATGQQDGRHVAGLVVGQPRGVVLDLAEHRDDGHQQPRVLEDGRAPRRTRSGRRRTPRAQPRPRPAPPPCPRRRSPRGCVRGVGLSSAGGVHVGHPPRPHAT